MGITGYKFGAVGFKQIYLIIAALTLQHASLSLCFTSQVIFSSAHFNTLKFDGAHPRAWGNVSYSAVRFGIHLSAASTFLAEFTLKFSIHNQSSVACPGYTICKQVVKFYHKSHTQFSSYFAPTSNPQFPAKTLTCASALEPRALIPHGGHSNSMYAQFHRLLDLYAFLRFRGIPSS